MRFLCRFGGGMVLLLATVGVRGCLTGAIGVWIFHQRASQRVENLAARLDVGLERASVARRGSCGNQDVANHGPGPVIVGFSLTVRTQSMR
jgi:hypothetical protein